MLPAEVLRLPEELARVDAWLDDPGFWVPFVPFFSPVLGRPSTPIETYLRMMFLKFRYRMGYETLCREVSDSITWRRFCRIPLHGRVPHPTSLMKLTTRCGAAVVDGLNEALVAKAAEAKLLRTTRVRVDTTWCPRTWRIRPTQGCWPRRCAGSRRPHAGCRRLVAGPGLGYVTAVVPPAPALMGSRRSCARGPRWVATRPRPGCGGSPESWLTWPNVLLPRLSGCWPTPVAG